MKTLLDEKNDWIQIRTNLLSKGGNRTNLNDDWKAAILLFEGSLRNKFINPLINIQDYGDENGEGYSIVSLTTILIEILASYKYGYIFRHDRKVYDYEYNDNKELFIRFLNNNEIFKNTFDSIEVEYNNPEVLDCYKDFYWNVRCALVHEGQLKNGWIVSTTEVVENSKKIFISFGQENKIIYRNVLISLIEEYFVQYLLNLSGDRAISNICRLNFARRFDNHFGLDYTEWQ